MSGQGNLLIIGHRGASADHTENTVDAFRGAREQGADWVELDVRTAADGALIVHHDAWYRDGRTVWDTPAADRPPGVPVLAEALDACAGMGVNVEIKNSPGDLGGDQVRHSLRPADIVLELLAARSAAGVEEQILVSSFDIPTLDRIRSLDRHIATGYLVFDLNAVPDAPQRAADGGHDALHPWDPFVDEALVRSCHDVGLLLNTWTVDEHDRIQDLALLGVDGIITNVPRLARQALGRD